MAWPAGFAVEVGEYADRSNQQSVRANVPVPASAKLHPAGAASGAAEAARVPAAAAAAVVIRSIPTTMHAHAATRQASPHSVDRELARLPRRLQTAKPTPPDSAPLAPAATWRVGSTLAPLGYLGKSPGEQDSRDPMRFPHRLVRLPPPLPRRRHAADTKQRRDRPRPGRLVHRCRVHRH